MISEKTTVPIGLAVKVGAAILALGVGFGGTQMQIMMLQTEVRAQQNLLTSQQNLIAAQEGRIIAVETKIGAAHLDELPDKLAEIYSAVRRRKPDE